jgi:hypothetical protein
MANTGPGGHPAAPPGGSSRRRAAVRRWAALVKAGHPLVFFVLAALPPQVSVFIAVAADLPGWTILVVVVTAVATSLALYSRRFRTEADRLEADRSDGVAWHHEPIIIAHHWSSLRVSVRRAVNTLLYTGGAPVGRDRPLELGGTYQLLVNLGPYNPRSLVMNATKRGVTE